MAFFLLFLASLPLFCAGKAPPYENVPSLEAARILGKIAGQDPSTLKKEAELREWAQARLAWIALRRLEGQDAEALKIFSGCGAICGKYGSVEEWKAIKEWGCQKKREAIPCLSSVPVLDQIQDKTKAQKPPR